MEIDMNRMLAVALVGLPAATFAQTEGDAPATGRGTAYLQSPENADIQTADGRRIGTVERILIDADGVPAAYLAEIGGFLDIGDHDVAIPLDALEWDDAHYVSLMTEEQLRNLEQWQE
jgi:hypothetical protein